MRLTQGLERPYTKNVDRIIHQKDRRKAWQISFQPKDINQSIKYMIYIEISQDFRINKHILSFIIIDKIYN